MFVFVSRILFLEYGGWEDYLNRFIFSMCCVLSVFDCDLIIFNEAPKSI